MKIDVTKQGKLLTWPFDKVSQDVINNNLLFEQRQEREELEYIHAEMQEYGQL